ncbi:ABC transporter substrate-binding protein [Jatrophihabitans telluris]|uniref:ABC transporter substrate-binding protein n=1 Tax=Jatrophihabitans telluris TaxID=2038343 RepID=A0ABY4QWJ3_9ACTN|nr:ABC transporter substrate-binding protein [Jatrophihabitans telluris]UQX87718.1 ABC transporter substrate-binding protein [Jatrophihabitans telluris]
MSGKRLKIGGLAIAVTAALVLSACGSSKSSNSTNNSSAQTNANGTTAGVSAAFNNASTGFVNKSDKTGGNLKLLANADCDSWDPARTYYAWCFNMQRIFTRTLVGFSSLPGANNVKIEPDLAAGLGQHNADFTQWTYKLQSGLKWDDGSPITSKDVKYGIERLFAQDVINGGPSSYFLALIKNSGYKGPYKGGSLDTIQTPDDQTITFNLTSSYADFDYLMTLPAAAPVPADKEGGSTFKGASYTNHPASSGPYKISQYTPKKSITFVKNPQWSQSTDKIRTPKADTITLTFDSNLDDEDQQLQSGQADAEADQGVNSTLQSKIATDPNLKKNADDPITGFTRYLAVMQTVAPLTNVHCRNAVFYAINKAALLRARGGQYGGQIANTMSPPVIAGYDASANPFPTGADSTGDLTKAKDELKACGQPSGFSTKMAYSTSAHSKDVFIATQQSLARVGIKLTGAQQDSSNYYSTFIGSPANIKSQGLGLAVAGWGADFPTGFGFWNSIVYGKNLPATGNTNYVSLNDPKVNSILETVVKSAGTHDSDFKTLDAQVMSDAVYLPYVYDKTLFYRNPRITNVRVNFALGGYYDFVNIGTSDGK